MAQTIHVPQGVYVVFDGVREAQTLLSLAQHGFDSKARSGSMRPRTRRFAGRSMARLATAIDNAAKATVTICNPPSK